MGALQSSFQTRLYFRCIFSYADQILFIHSMIPDIHSQDEFAFPNSEKQKCKGKALTTDNVLV